MSYEQAGFTTSQGRGGADSSQREQRNNSLRPVTIRQILNAHEPTPDDDTQIDGHPVSRVSIVAQIRAVSNLPGGAKSYTLEDGTGSIEVKRWPDASTNTRAEDDDEDGEDEVMQEARLANDLETGQYAHVLGSSRVFNNKRTVTVMQMRAVEDHNEVLYHQAKALQTHLLLTKGGVSEGATGKVDNAGDKQDKSIFVEGGGVSNETQRKIKEVLSTAPPETGLHVEEVARKAGLATNLVRKELEDMEQTGTAYQADEEHWLSI